MPYFYFNGDFLLNGSKIIGPDNKGFKYGDGLFETIRCKENKLLLFKEHVSRLFQGLQVLKFSIPTSFSLQFLEDACSQLILKNKLVNARVRITVFRDDGTIFNCESDELNLLIEATELLVPNVNNKLKLCIYKDAIKSIDRFSNIKHNNYLPYSMAARYACENNFDDALVLNSKKGICETAIANVFIIKNNQIQTPALTEACINGIMRNEIIRTALQVQISVIETEISLNDLLEADEIFISNAIHPIRSVGFLEGKSLPSLFTMELIQTLRQTNPLIFC